jgi:formamidopyrimidine-DNA glycosylase
MPELPEVETIARRLREHCLGREVAEVVVLREKSFRGQERLVVGARLERISRRAKILNITLSNHQILLVHLKMTGQLIFVDDQVRVGGGHPTADWVRDLPSAHTRVILRFSDGSQLFFNDQRVFGWVWVTNQQAAGEYLHRYAPDIVDPDFSEIAFFDQTQRTMRPIKTVLLDSSIVSGIGNIYACDALHLAGIHPSTPAQELNLSQISQLFHSAKEVIQLGITYQGATIHTHATVDGFSGQYQHHRRVYARTGEPCPVCATVIQKYQLAGRGTFYCPKCQGALVY